MICKPPSVVHFTCIFFIACCAIEQHPTLVNSQSLDWLAEHGNCQFYDVLEQSKQCGPKGYLIGYGGKYCRKFGENADEFNEAGKLWIKGVRKCLMHYILRDIDYKTVDCDELKRQAFESHVQCYVKPGYDSGDKGICQIWASKDLVGLFDTLEIKDFFQSPLAITQIFKVMFDCFNEYFGGLEQQ